MVEEKEVLLNVRDEIVDSIDDIEDYLHDYDDGVMVNKVLSRLVNALELVNEVLEEKGIHEDYVPDG